MPMRYLIATTFLLASCSLWQREVTQTSVSEEKQETNVQSVASGDQASPPATAAVVPNNTAPPSPAEASSSAAPALWQPKVLTQEEQEFITDTSEWMAQVRFIIQYIRKLSMQAQGAAMDLEEVDLQKKYRELHEATARIRIPEGHEAARTLVEKFDTSIGEAVEKLASPSSLQALEEATKIVNSLTSETNELNRLLSDIRNQETLQ